MALQTEIWASEIAANLFPMDDFISKALSDDAWVDNKVVHRPIAGTPPVVVKNRASYPATIGQRTDTEMTYNLAEYTTNPHHLTDVDAIEINYDKRSSIINEHSRQLNLKIANDMAFNWCATAAANILRTTGAARNAVATATGATGTRKALTLQDVMNAASRLDNMDVPRGDGKRYILLPADMYADIMSTNFATLAQLQASGEAILKDAQLMNLFGFKVYTRGVNNILRYNNAGTPVPIDPSTAGAATDNAGALCWHSDFVCRAKGAVKVYYKEDQPEYYGSIFSAMLRAGGAKTYTNGTGVVSIVEAV